MQLARIVVGVDLTSSSTQAAAWAARAFAPEAEVVLLHCLNPLLLERQLADERQLAERCLVDLERRIGAERSSHRVRVGEPARCLAEVAAKLDADLIAVGSHEEHPGRELQPGSTAERLVRCATVPVLLCSETPAGAPRSLLLPLDSAKVRTSVAEWTRALAERFGARLALVQVEAPRHGPRLTGNAEHAAPPRTASTTPWTEVTRELAPDRIFVDAVLGERADAVLAEAQRFHTELVLLGAPSDDDAEDLSSSVDRVLRRSQCPVLVIPLFENALETR